VVTRYFLNTTYNQVDSTDVFEADIGRPVRQVFLFDRHAIALDYASNIYTLFYAAKKTGEKLENYQIVRTYRFGTGREVKAMSYYDQNEGTQSRSNSWVFVTVVKSSGSVEISRSQIRTREIERRREY